MSRQRDRPSGDVCCGEPQQKAAKKNEGRVTRHKSNASPRVSVFFFIFDWIVWPDTQRNDVHHGVTDDDEDADELRHWHGAQSSVKL